LIYFAQAIQDELVIKAGWIKIGTTVRLTERLRQIQRDIRHLPTVLGVMNGSHADETALHRKFEAFHRVGEWFDPHDLLLAFIKTEAREWDGEDEAPPNPHRAPIRLSAEAIRSARIASGYTGESVAEYASRVLAERGKEDADKLHTKLKGAEAKAEAHKKKESKH
jgi:hypothetical protein